jgi:hypothetical protein
MPLRHPLPLALLLYGISSPLLPQANSLDRLLTMQMNWDAAKANDQDKPVVTLHFIPFAHRQKDGKSFTSYFVEAAGAAENTPYTLIRWPIGWNAELPPFDPVDTHLFVNARGVVMRTKPTEKQNTSDAPALESEARLEVTAAGAPGEPVRFALLDSRQNFVAMGRVIVNPIRSSDKTCAFQAIRAVGGGEIVLAEGTGFAADAPVEISREMDGAIHAAQFRTDAKGRIEAPVILISKEQSQGTATLMMKSDGCAPSLKLNWGHDSYKVQ